MIALVLFVTLAWHPIAGQPQPDRCWDGEKGVPIGYRLSEVWDKARAGTRAGELNAEGGWQVTLTDIGNNRWSVVAACVGRRPEDR